jgi:hypothetical protein
MSDREAFEKWAKGNLDLQHIGVCYGDDVAEAAWQAWQAAQAQAVNQQLLDALEDMFEAAGSIPADPKNFKKYPALMPSMCKARDAILAAKQAAKRQEGVICTG